MFLTRSFINVFSKKAIGFHNRKKPFEFNFLIRKVPADRQTRRAKSASANQSAQCPALNKTPANSHALCFAQNKERYKEVLVDYKRFALVDVFGIKLMMFRVKMETGFTPIKIFNNN